MNKPYLQHWGSFVNYVRALKCSYPVYGKAERGRERHRERERRRERERERESEREREREREKERERERTRAPHPSCDASLLLSFSKSLCG